MTFPLKIVTPRSLAFDGPAEKLIVRTLSGDTAILARHMDFAAALGSGQLVVEAAGTRKTADCTGGLVRVFGGEVTVITAVFRWRE